MKKLEAIVRPERAEAVVKALEQKGFTGLTQSQVKGRGRQKGIVLQWRAGEYRVDMLPKVKIEVVVKDAQVDVAASVIVEAAKTGKVGDGKIFVSPIEEVIRVRTGERGDEAI